MLDGEKEKKAIEPTPSSSDDDDFQVTFDHSGPSQVSVNESDSEVSTDDEPDSSFDSSEVAEPRRSSRLRNPPLRYGNTVAYDSHAPLPGEHEVTTSWWSGYPRGTWNEEQ